MSQKHPNGKRKQVVSLRTSVCIVCFWVNFTDQNGASRGYPMQKQNLILPMIRAWKKKNKWNCLFTFDIIFLELWPWYLQNENFQFAIFLVIWTKGPLGLVVQRTREFKTLLSVPLVKYIINCTLNHAITSTYCGDDHSECGQHL